MVNENTGTFIAATSYDTWGDANAADNLAQYINNLPAGRIVLVGIKDDGSWLMNENAFHAMESLGSALCRNVRLVIHGP